MKKILALMLVLVMAVSMAACAGNNNNETTEAQTTAPAFAEGNTLVALQNIWAKYSVAGQFPVMGGNPEDGSMEGPALWNKEYLENLAYTLYIPEADMASIDEAATVVNMMMANNFSCGVLHLTEGTDIAAFAATMCDALKNNQWICGQPDQVLIAEVDGCVLVAFGVNDGINPFATAVTEGCPSAKVLYQEALNG